MSATLRRGVYCGRHEMPVAGRPSRKTVGAGSACVRAARWTGPICALRRIVSVPIRGRHPTFLRRKPAPMFDVCYCMGTMSPLEAVVPVDDRTPAVAVVAADGNVRRRATFALDQDGQVVLIQAASSDELDPEAAQRADAVVIAAAAKADRRAAAIRAARMRLADARVVVIATADANGVQKALEAGAHGFVFEVDLLATLAPTVRAVLAGQIVVPPMARASVVRPPLSHREKQTLGLLVLGLTNAEIAQRLYLAESTVKSHLTSIFSKLGVRSRNEAVARVVDRHDGLGLGVLGLSADANHWVRT